MNWTVKDMIYLKLNGRIGNQLFMYAVAETIRNMKGTDEVIIIDDYGNIAPDGTKYENSLVHYNLKNVRFVHDSKSWHSMGMLPMRLKWFFIKHVLERGKNNDEIYRINLKCQKLFNALGIFHMQDGYVEYPHSFRKNVLVSGYFQSEKYFLSVKNELSNKFRIEEELINSNYPNLDLIKRRNTVCISIKVQHNAGNYMYDVCTKDYYEKAIRKIEEIVDNPLFFVCSDNVEYVKEHLIDTEKYDVICQEKGFPVHISLAVMARCKHYIIGNTSFGWWAQYLSTYDNKVVIAPSRWYNGQGDWQYDIYMDDWTVIDV